MTNIIGICDLVYFYLNLCVSIILRVNNETTKDKNMRPIHKQAIILSAELSDQTDIQNKHQTDTLEARLKQKNASYKHLVGSYKGIREASFLIEVNDNFNLFDAEALGCRFGQESVLVLDEDRNASLVTLNIKLDTVKIGKLKAITNKEAIKLEAWSYCPLNNQFYGVV